jgi:hypothetical protein
MASTHFIVQAPVENQGGTASTHQSVSLHVEVEGSAPIKSNIGLVRVSRAIAADELGRAVGSGTLGEFTVTQTKGFEKEGEPLTHPDHPGTYVWRVSTGDAAAT